MRILKWTAVVSGSLMVLAVTAAMIRFHGPRNLIGYIRYDQRQEGSLVPGHDTPDVELVALDGAGRVHVRDWIGQKPLVLIFGSFT
ncbi:MAG TPA: hypothetical protein VGK31_05010 [Thermoanaerobaculia bacterium]